MLILVLMLGLMVGLTLGLILGVILGLYLMSSTNTLILLNISKKYLNRQTI